jgi:lipopolysaccharide transport system ATP-binding protein
MKNLVISVDNISKLYRLGEIGSGTLYEDLNRFWHKIRGKEDPYLLIGDLNDRAAKGGSNYVWALKDISFDLRQGQVLGVIGKNGAGKSTLLKLLSKVSSPSTGSIKIKGRVASLLEVGTGFHPELTGRENIFLNGTILGMTKREVGKKLEEIADFAGCTRYLDTPTKRYSSGMMVRLGFSVAAHLEPEILIVDEVLAVGDADFQKKCLGKMSEVSKTGRTILFVSHNMGSVRTLCDTGILLEKGRLVFSGSATEAVDRYLSGGNNEGEAENKVVFNPKDVFAQLLELSIENQDGESVDTYYYGERLFLKIKYVLREDRRNLWVKFALARNGEVLFQSYDIDEINLPAMRMAGEYVARIELPSFLKAGVFTISASMVEVGQYFDEQIDALKFLLDDTKTDTADKAYRNDKPGILRLPLRWDYVERPVLSEIEI